MQGLVCNFDHGFRRLIVNMAKSPGISGVVRPNRSLICVVKIVTARLYGPENSIHIEVLLPAFVVGMLMKHKEIDTAR